MSLKQKSTNEVSGFEASTQYEHWWDMSVKATNFVGADSVSARLQMTDF